MKINLSMSYYQKTLLLVIFLVALYLLFPSKIMNNGDTETVEDNSVETVDN